MYLGTGSPGTTGTPFDINVLDYLNNEQYSTYDYAFHENTTLSAMQSRLNSSIDLYDMPPVLWIITSSSSEWGIDYNHVVTVSKITSDNNTVGIGDPWPLYAGTGSSFYTISANGVYGGLIYMIW